MVTLAKEEQKETLNIIENTSVEKHILNFPNRKTKNAMETSTKTKQESVINTASKAFLKTLLISHIQLVDICEDEAKKEFSFRISTYRNTLKLIINKATKALSITQDGFVIVNNSDTCELVLNKML